MKLSIVSAMICALLMFGTGNVKADEVQELKEQLQLLQKRIEELEKKQAEQETKTDDVEKSVDRLKKQPSASSTVREALADRTTVSGHFKFFLADQSHGKVNDIDQHDSLSAGISNLWLYFNRKMTDWMNIEVAPELIVQAAATPSLGANIIREDSPSVDVDLSWVYVGVRLPWELELKAGTFFPYFSEEYASKVWWNEQYNGNKGLLTLQNWRSTGIELYRNFDFENFSMPVYIYPYLNGDDRGIIQDSRLSDNNSAKSFLAHVAPEFYAFGGRFRFMTSFGMGKWNDDGDKNSYQWSIGADVTRGSFNISGEYLNRRREDLPLLGGGFEDGEDNGWYLKGLYRITPKWRATLKYSDVDLWYSGMHSLLTDNYKTFSTAINFFLMNDSIIIPQIEYVDADRSDSSQTIKYIRYTLGWRTTY